MRGKEKGFTLIEVIAALAILSLAIVPLLIENGNNIREVDRTRQRRMAWMLLASKMAELQSDPNAALLEGATGQGDFYDRGEIYQGFSWSYEVDLEELDISDPLYENLEGEEGEETPPVDPRETASEGKAWLLQVKLTVSWMDGGVEEKAFLTAYLPHEEEPDEQPANP